ncbi:MAG: DMT family transporter, partial [Mycobacteriales bacterium]
MLAIIGALLAAVCFALASVLQYHAAARAPFEGGLGLGLLGRLLRRPLWLLGLVAAAGGLALHAYALSAGPLVVVQPLLVSGMLFALPASVLLARCRPRLPEWRYAGVVVTGLALFLLAAHPAEGSTLADQGVLGATTGAGVIVAALCLLLARRPHATHRAALLGTAGGICFGVTAALLKQTVDQAGAAPLRLLTTWPVYALVLIGVVGTAIVQASYQAGSLAASLPPLTITDPLVAVGIGAAAFGETLAHNASALTGQIIGFLLMTFGVLRLAALSRQPPPVPAAGPGLGDGAVPGASRPIGVRPAADPPPAPTAVLIISGSVGAGHDGAAHELAARLRAAGVQADVRDYLQALPRWFRYVLRDGYTLSVERAPAVFEWLFVSIERSPLVRGVTIACCRMGNRQVRRWSREKAYAAVVSTYPLASQTLGMLRLRGDVTVPILTYLTDPAVHRSWVHPAVDEHLTVTEASARQGQATYRLPMTAAGPLVPARFATVITPARRRSLRHELGLPADRRVALLVTGSLGLGDVEHSARHVLTAGLTPLVLCGRNQALRERLSRLPGVVSLGWRDDVHELLHLADVLVHNAGGLSFTEAMVAGLPAVSYRCIPGHGVANAAILDAAGLAPWARDSASFITAVRDQATGRRPAGPQRDPAEIVLGYLPRIARYAP